ncbi:hypothetical protein FHL15_005018 [Xylaria flabelliformis]|uniref:Uncharacterized protein n=1 Tax=Xylaria flabelliformis TaxID=2512241 RepID=A0A553I169_9PEZI|nr:hypothetical protein FHL15_005018 [Xylaria flabelliformis]
MPPFAVSCAVLRSNLKLLSLTLEVNIDHNASTFGTYGTLLRLALRLNSIQTSIMLLKAGVDVTHGDSARATLLGDQDLGKEILRRNPLEATEDDLESSEVTLLGAALLTGNSSLVQEAWKRNPTCYNPAALCAATFRVSVSEMDPRIILKLLGYRNPKSTYPRSRLLETTATGIAACYEQIEILQQLFDHVPMSKDAYLPAKQEFLIDQNRFFA